MLVITVCNIIYATLINNAPYAVLIGFIFICILGYCIWKIIRRRRNTKACLSYYTITVDGTRFLINGEPDINVILASRGLPPIDKEEYAAKRIDFTSVDLKEFIKY